MDIDKMEKCDCGDCADHYFTIVPDTGLCLVGDVMVNLRQVTVIQKRNDQTLIYYSGVKEPIALPAEVFEDIREAAFSMDNLDYDDAEFDYDDDDEDEEEYDMEDDEEEDDEDEDEDDDEEDDEPPVSRKRKK